MENYKHRLPYTQNFHPRSHSYLADAIHTNGLQTIRNLSRVSEVYHAQTQSGTTNASYQPPSNQHLVGPEGLCIILDICAREETKRIDYVSRDVENKSNEDCEAEANIVRQIAEYGHEKKLREIITAEHKAIEI